MSNSLYKYLSITISVLTLTACPNLGQQNSSEESHTSENGCERSGSISDSNCSHQNSKWQTIAASPIHSQHFGYDNYPADIYWTGQKIIAWGNMITNVSSSGQFGGQSITGTGEIYDPKNNTWSSIGTTNAPAARTSYISAFTGTEIIVWGGRDISAEFVFGDGGIYNIATNSWSSISIVNAPTTRFAAMSVWTGENANANLNNKLIVFGGADDFTSTTLNDGGIYDRATDTWTDISNVNAPSPRRYTQAIWTGSEMIVWGGTNMNVSGSPQALNDGARFNPLTNSWSPISNIGAPSPRSLHAIVWTGSRMVVWGGGDMWGNGTGTYLNDGAVYDPATDSWSQISNVNAPTARSYHSYIWTGNKLIIFGGRNYSILMNDGSIYDPVLNIWESLPEDTSITPRTHPSLLWTGSSLYVYGGQTAGMLPPATLVYNSDSKKIPSPTLPSLLPEPQLPASPWIAGSIAPNQQSSIAFGNGIFVALTYNSNTAYSSVDGVNWTSRSLPLSSSWIAVAYGNGIFVATTYNNNVSAISTDGTNWTASTLPASKNWNSIAFGNGKFLALANGGYAAISPDGLNWSLRTLPVSIWSSISFGNGYFVAVGSNSSGSSAGISGDGVNWTVSGNSKPYGWNSVTYGNGKFVAIGSSGSFGTVVSTSSDGITWVQGRMPSIQMWNNVVFGNGLFVATVFTGKIVAVSRDGITWTQQAIPIISSAKIGYGNGRFVILCASGPDQTGKTAYADLQ